MLLEECRKQSKPYGLIFDDIEGGYTTTERSGPQAFTVLPLVVHRVYTGGRSVGGMLLLPPCSAQRSAQRPRRPSGALMPLPPVRASPGAEPGSGTPRASSRPP